MNNLKFLMNRAGLSCLDIAKKLRVSQQAVYKWETGAAMPSAASAGLHHRRAVRLLPAGSGGEGQRMKTAPAGPGRGGR